MIGVWVGPAFPASVVSSSCFRLGMNWTGGRRVQEGLDQVLSIGVYLGVDGIDEAI